MEAAASGEVSRLRLEEARLLLPLVLAPFALMLPAVVELGTCVASEKAAEEPVSERLVAVEVG